MNRMRESFYNNGSGLGIGPQPGPYSYLGDVTIYPLRASEDKLWKFVDRYFWKKDFPRGTYLDTNWPWVFLFVSEVEIEQSDSKIGAEKYTALSFRVPLLVNERGSDLSRSSNGYNSENGEIAFVEIFSFVDSIPAVLTSREARGLNARYATFGKASASESLKTNLGKSASSGVDTHDLSDSLRIENISTTVSAAGEPASLLSMVTKVSDEVGLSTEARDEVLLLIRTLNAHDADLHCDEMPLLNPRDLLKKLKGVEFRSWFDQLQGKRIWVQHNETAQLRPREKGHLDRGLQEDDYAEDDTTYQMQSQVFDPVGEEQSTQKTIHTLILELEKRGVGLDLTDEQVMDVAAASKLGLDVPWEIDELREILIDRDRRKKRLKESEEELFAWLFSCLKGRLPMRLYTIKQFPDASDGRKASYQALVRIESSFTGVADGEKQAKISVADAGCIVRIYNFASHPLNSVLGFQPANGLRSSASATESYCGWPICVRDCKIIEDRGVTLFYRSQATGWFDTQKSGRRTRESRYRG